MFERKIMSFSRVVVVVLVVWTGVGCNAGPDVGTRYELEKSIWAAEQLRKRAVSDPFNEREEDLQAAAAIYERILGTDRFTAATDRYKESSVGRDLARLLLRCKIARAELCFADFQNHAGVAYPAPISDPHDLLFARGMGLELTRVPALYGPGPAEFLQIRCAEAFETVAKDTLLWTSDVTMGDTLLAGPASLARNEVETEGGRTLGCQRMAESFYARIIGMGPQEPLANKARVRRAEVRTSLGRFDEALRDIDEVLRNPTGQDRRRELLLWRGEILAHGLDRDDEARRVLSTVVSEFRGSPEARRAIVSLALLEARRGRHGDAARMLHELEVDPATPRSTAAASMFVRALELERRGEWVEATQLLRQVSRSEPSTDAAAVSPFVMIDHYVEARDTAAVERTLQEAGEFYCDAIARATGDAKRSHVLIDFLIESHLLAGKPAAAAELLETRAPGWRRDTGSTGLYKAALIYLKLVHDEKNGIRMLQKCLDVFPTSRYAWIVREELDKISPTGSMP